MKWLAPEVIQTSAMDCGPAALKCVLEGFGVRVGYGRLREACQTDVDGTSIDTVEDVACALGLDAEQRLIPPEHVLLPQAGCFPAIAVLNMPNGLNHFVVLYRRSGSWVQIMDPERGRQWVHVRALHDQLYIHPTQVPAAAFREFAGSPQMIEPIKQRLARLGISARRQQELVLDASRDEDWRPMAALDAAIRAVTSLESSGAVRRGPVAERLISAVTTEALANREIIPTRSWSVGPIGEVDGEEWVWMRGAVVIAIRGMKDPEADTEAPTEAPAGDLARALREPPLAPLRELLRLLRADGKRASLTLLAVLAFVAVGSLAEVVVLRGLLDLGDHLASHEQRIAAGGAMVSLLLVLALLHWPQNALVKGLGRRLETRVRIEFQSKVPRLPDRYFRSRLISDMSERSHSLASIPQLPHIIVDLFGAGFGLFAVVLGLAWIDPRGAPLAIGSALASILIPLVFLPLLSERAYRVRTHLGSLAGAYLDALIGITAVRSHGAEPAVRRQHEKLLVEWHRSTLAMIRASVGVEAIVSLLGFTLAVLLVGDYVIRRGEVGGTLLIAYWALSIPNLGKQVAHSVRAYPQVRSVFLRVLEVLKAPEDSVEPRIDDPSASLAEDSRESGLPAGASISFANVAVQGGGTTILDDITLELEAGQHVALVGTSGAGKSSLLSVLLGFNTPSRGTVRIDGERLDPKRLAGLRSRIAWIDPTVQLWNRSLLANLRYGGERGTAGLGSVLEDATLFSVLERLPEGLGTNLGEGGAMLSGGEGQRVRAGRAFLRSGVRLALLDEPFRGLDRTARRSLMASARRIFADATLLAVTHDVRDTDAFERVLVVDGGRVVEDGAPSTLLADPQSKYAVLYHRDASLADRLWNNTLFRRVHVEAGRITPMDQEVRHVEH